MAIWKPESGHPHLPHFEKALKCLPLPSGRIQMNSFRLWLLTQETCLGRSPLSSSCDSVSCNIQVNLLVFVFSLMLASDDHTTTKIMQTVHTDYRKMKIKIDQSWCFEYTADLWTIWRLGALTLHIVEKPSITLQSVPTLDPVVL